MQEGKEREGQGREGEGEGHEERVARGTGRSVHVRVKGTGYVVLFVIFFRYMMLNLFNCCKLLSFPHCLYQFQWVQEEGKL